MTLSVCLWMTLLTTATVCLSYGSLQLGSRSSIVGGEDAPPGHWPWMVYLQISNGTHAQDPSMRCGGSLVNRQWVLTAAHCLVFEKGKIKLQSSFARLGVLKLADSKTGKHLFFKRAVVHPEYHSLKQNDIALVQLKKPVDFSKTVAPVKLPRSRDKNLSRNSECWVTGWGRIAENRPLGGDRTLQQVKVPLVDNSICRQKYYGITNNQLCAGGEPDKDSCQGDSGGPLVCRRNALKVFVQVGVVSYGRGCGRPGTPGVYTRVSSYMDFIKDSIRKYG